MGKVKSILMAILVACIIIGVICIISGILGGFKIFTIIMGIAFIGTGIIAYTVGNDRLDS